MRKLLLLIIMFISISANAMEIKTDEIDEFTGLRTVITSWENVDKNQLFFRFRQQSGKIWLDMKFSPDNAIVIGQNDKLLFKSASDSIASFYSTNIYSGGIGQGAIGLNGSGRWGIKASYLAEDADYFKNNITRLVRIYATDGYYDRKITPTNGEKLGKLYALFQDALNSSKGSLSLKDYTIQYCKKSKSSKEWKVADERTIERVSKEDLTKIINEWESQTNDTHDYKCKVKKAKSK